MEMDSPEDYNLFFDSGPVDDMIASGGDFEEPGTFCWPSDGASLPVNANSDTSCRLEVYGSDGPQFVAPHKRLKPEDCSRYESKASREKRRRDMLNDRFLELASLMEPDKQPKLDKSAILIDAIHMVTQLRNEAQNLKESNENLRQSIKELKTEKYELRDEKQRLKSEKEHLEQQLRNMNAVQHSYLSFPTALPVAGSKLTPIHTYPGFPMWQFMPPAAVDTSQDHVLRPPVA